MPTTTSPAINANPITDVKGGSTTDMIVKLAQARWGVPAGNPEKDPAFVEGILRNAEITDISKNIQSLETTGNNLYTIQDEVTTLIANLATSTLVKEDTKKQLGPRVQTLKDMIDSGIDASTLLTTIETKAPELEEQHLALMRAHYNPKKYPLTIAITEEKIDKAVEETKKSVDQLAKTLLTTEKQVGITYTNIREGLPGTGTLTLKPINVLTAPKAETPEPEINRPRNE